MNLRRWLALVMAVAMIMSLGGAATVAAAESPGQAEAVAMLTGFGIIQGDEGGLRLDDNITRAELIKVLVTAAGQGEHAALLAGALAFKDTREHWASGHVALAKNMGLTTGYPDGTFRPGTPVTYAEAVALLARLVGIQPAAGAWPHNYLNAAAAAGIIPAGTDLTHMADMPAARGAVFQLAHNSFLKVQGDEGKNLYQRFFDGTPPSLSVGAFASPTVATSIVVSGQSDAGARVEVDGQAVTLADDGSFTATVDLALGNNEITVTATDTVGNTARHVVQVERITTPPAAIEAPESITVPAGETVPLAVTVLDVHDVELDASVLAATVEGDIGTYDAATGQFTAGPAAGTGLLTLTAGELSATVAVTVVPGPAATVEIQASPALVGVGELAVIQAVVKDAHGNVVDTPATYSVEGADALINPQSGQFIASRSGIYTVTATAGDITGKGSVGVYGSVAKLALEGPDTLVGNGSSTATFTVTALDEHGNRVSSAATALQVVADDLTVLPSDSFKLDGGTATFKVRTDNALWGVITSVRVSEEGGGENRLTVARSLEIVEQVATGLKTAAADKYLTANDDTGRATVKFQVVDQDGVGMLEDAWDIDYEITGPAVDVAGARKGTGLTTDGAFTLTLHSLRGEVGPVRVTATVEDLGSASAELTAAVAAAPAQVVLELGADTATVTDAAADGVALTATVTDERGIPVRVTGDVIIEFAGGITDATAGIIDGDTLTLELDDAARASTRVAHTKAGANKITAKFEKLTPGTATLTLNPAAAKYARFARKPMMVLPIDKPEATVAIQIYDRFLNPVKKAGVNVTITGRNDTTKTGEITINEKPGEATVTTDGDGRAEVTFRTRPYTGRDYNLAITAADVEPHAAGSILDLTIASTVAEKLGVALKRVERDGADVTYQDFVATNADQEVAIMVTVRDRYGTSLPDYAPYFVLDVADGHWSVDDDGTPDKADDVSAAAFTYDADLEAYVLHLYAAGAQRAQVGLSMNPSGRNLSDSDSVLIRPGADHRVTLAEASGGKVTVKRGSIKGFTLRVADRWGNLKSGDKAYQVSFTTIPDADSQVIVRSRPEGHDLGDEHTISVRTSTSVHLLVLTGTGGTLTIRDSGAELVDTDITVVAE